MSYYTIGDKLYPRSRKVIYQPDLDIQNTNLELDIQNAKSGLYYINQEFVFNYVSPELISSKTDETS